jgi:hypothetical protein
MLDIREASMNEGERDISVNALNHAREAWGYNVQATNYRNEASAARAAGRNAMLGGFIGGASSLLSLAAPASAASRGAGNGIRIQPSPQIDPRYSDLWSGLSGQRR